MKAISAAGFSVATWCLAAEALGGGPRDYYGVSSRGTTAMGADHHHRSLAFGDHIDTSFACPATVTCNIVCVANVTDCPADAMCPGTTADGSANNNSNRTYEVRT